MPSIIKKKNPRCPCREKWTVLFFFQIRQYWHRLDYHSAN